MSCDNLTKPRTPLQSGRPQLSCTQYLKSDASCTVPCRLARGPSRTDYGLAAELEQKKDLQPRRVFNRRRRGTRALRRFHVLLTRFFRRPSLCPRVPAGINRPSWSRAYWTRFSLLAPAQTETSSCSPRVCRVIDSGPLISALLASREEPRGRQ